MGSQWNPTVKSTDISLHMNDHMKQDKYCINIINSLPSKRSRLLTKCKKSCSLQSLFDFVL